MEIGHPVDRTDDDLAEHDDHEEVEPLDQGRRRCEYVTSLIRRRRQHPVRDELTDEINQPGNCSQPVAHWR